MKRRSFGSRSSAAGPGLDPVAALRETQPGPPLLAYLARTLVDGSPHVAALVDEMVTDAEGYMAEGVRTGVLRPSDYRYERAVVLTMWSQGALVLHDHLQRLLGVDLAPPTRSRPRARTSPPRSSCSAPGCSPRRRPGSCGRRSPRTTSGAVREGS
ncbi:MAG TPA: hypothetical protein VM324_00215 [Egibacteraceae bacterium]|nr:hypothetical protein [Egibacteraceae bacterium]